MGPMKSKPHFIKGFDIGRMVTSLTMLDVIRLLIFFGNNHKLDRKYDGPCRKWAINTWHPKSFGR